MQNLGKDRIMLLDSKEFALANTQAKAVCAMIKKAKPSVITTIALYP
jgi:hypothetical protein